MREQLKRILDVPGRETVLAAFLLPPLPIGIPAASIFSQERMPYFIAAIILAVIIVSVLYEVARHSGAGAARNERSVITEETDTGEIGRMIVQELNRLPGGHKREAVAQQLSQMLNQKLESQAKELRKEISQKYEQIIEEKSKAETVVRKQFQQTVAEKRRTESVLRSVSEGVVVVDSGGKVVFMNPAAERLMGVRKEEKLGRALTQDIKDEQLVSMVNPEGSERDIEINANLDQTRRVLRASNAVVQDENGKTVGMVSVLSDVTKQRELDRLKSEFVSTVTHELRTPIVAMKHSLAVILDGSTGDLNEIQQNFLGIANRNLERLGRLVDDLLDLAKLEAKRITLEFQEASVEEVVDATIQAVNAWADSKHLRIEKKLGELPRVSMDPMRVGQVLNNLISNAIKFTPENGSITVSARSVPSDSSVEVRVKDSGIGIAKEDIGKLFQKFMQVGGSKASGGVSGTGLGLSIAKEIIELHGGRIWAESEPGHGAEFIFTLPLRQAG